MKPDKIPAFIEKMVEAWHDQDFDRFLDMLSEDVVWDDPAMQTPAVGREAIRRFSETVLRAFPDFQYSIRHPICIAPDGSRCAVPWRISATHLGRFDPPGYMPTGQRVVFDGVDVLDFDGEKVCRIETVFNVAVPAEQLLLLHIRPDVGSWRERLAVWIQRTRAWWLRTFRTSRS